jgi:peptide deformylase
MKVEDYLTHIDNSEDVQYLKGKAFPVNMRLFRTSPEYKAIVLQCCEYIKKLALTKMDGYKKPHGMSGANLAIPFNIIAFVANRGTEYETAEIMINPTVESYSEKKVKTRSNCGSIRLTEPIEITRFQSVRVSWYDENGVLRIATLDREHGGFTIQHEIDHNLGILITDRKTS